MAKSKASLTNPGKDCSTLNPINATQLTLPLNADVESVPPSKDPTGNDLSTSSDASTKKPKSSLSTDRDSTSLIKNCAPYWSDLCQGISSRLLLPVETDCAEKDLNYSSSWHNKTVANTWFKTNLFTATRPEKHQIFKPSLTSNLAECKDSGVTARRARKIRIFLNPEQRARLKQWFGTSRFVYNTTIKYLQQPETKANWLAIKGEILNGLPAWAKSVPYQIKSIAIKDACQGVKAAKKGFKTDGKIRHCKFRSRKDRQQSIFVPKTAIKDCGFYHTKIGQCRLTEALPKEFSDGRVTLAYGEYYLTVSEKVQPSHADNQGRVVALDPGVRTFMTFFSENSFGWLGEGANLRIQKLCFKLDKLGSRISLAKSRAKRRLKKAADRIRCRIKNLVKELHHKTAKFLVDNFDVILLPTFETSQMVSKSKRRIKSKSVRQMLTLSHYEFKQFLKWKAWSQSKVVIDCNEAYTSKTVSWTGEIINNLGGRTSVKSLATGLKMNRDLNGARGIFLRALVDTPWLREHLNLCVCSAFVSKKVSAL